MYEKGQGFAPVTLRIGQGHLSTLINGIP